MKSFQAVKKPIPVKVYDPLLTKVDDEGKALYESKEINLGGGYRGILFYLLNSGEEMEFEPHKCLIVIETNGERYAIRRDIFEETYDVVPEVCKVNLSPEVVDELDQNIRAAGVIGGKDNIRPEHHVFFCNGIKIPEVKEGEEAVKIDCGDVEKQCESSDMKKENKAYFYLEETYFYLEKENDKRMREGQESAVLRLNGMNIDNINPDISPSFRSKVIYHIIETEGLKTIFARVQNGAINEVGVNGIQLIELVKIVLEQYKAWQVKCPCRETALIITKLQEAIMWDEARTQDRVERGVEGTNKN